LLKPDNREDAMKTSILITGATGKTGLPLSQELADRKVPFRALIHSMVKEPLVRRWASDIVAGDYQDRDAMDEAFDGIERVYLVSPPAPDQEEVQTALVDIAKKKGVKHIVKLSALGASAASPVGLLRTHAAIEDHIRKSGLAWTFLQPHFFMENLLGNAESVIRDGVIYSPLGDAAISPISVHDIAAAAAEVLTGKGHEGKTYQLTGPQAMNYNGIARTLAGVTHKRVEYVPITFQAALQAMARTGMPDWLAGELLQLMKTWAEGKGSMVTKDVERIIKRTPITLWEFLECHKHMFTGKTAKAA
jgi:uncharacterized protein YbjT (DUF2867 family)